MNRDPIINDMDAIFVRARRAMPATDLLLRHCLTLGRPERARRPARIRLEEALGPELARRLLASLTAGGHR